MSMIRISTPVMTAANLHRKTKIAESQIAKTLTKLLNALNVINCLFTQQITHILIHTESISIGSML